MRRLQASIGRNAGVAVVTTLYMGLFLWLQPFRKRHRSVTVCFHKPLYAQAIGMLPSAVDRWKLLPRVSLLALTVLAAIANISAVVSQRSPSNASAPSQTTIALSATLCAGVAFVLVALPAAFFRAKLQDARERFQLRKVPCHSNLGCFAVPPSGCALYASPAGFAASAWLCSLCIICGLRPAATP